MVGPGIFYEDGERKTHSVRLAPYHYTWCLVVVNLYGAVSGLPGLLLWHTLVWATLALVALSTAHCVLALTRHIRRWRCLRHSLAPARLAWRCCGLSGFLDLAHFGFSATCTPTSRFALFALRVALCGPLRWYTMAYRGTSLAIRCTAQFC